MSTRPDKPVFIVLWQCGVCGTATPQTLESGHAPSVPLHCGERMAFRGHADGCPCSVCERGLLVKSRQQGATARSDAAYAAAAANQSTKDH